MKTQIVNGKKYYLHQDAGGKRIWKPVATSSDLQIIDVQDSPTLTKITATVQKVKSFPARVATSITGMNNGVQHSFTVNGNDIELDIDIQWNSRRSSELLRVFVNPGTVHQQSFQVDIDDQGNAQVLTGAAKVTSS